MPNEPLPAGKPPFGNDIVSSARALVTTHFEMGGLQLAVLLLLSAAATRALPTRIHSPSANSSVSQFDPNGAAAWAQV